MVDYNLKAITSDTDGPSADTELLFGAPDQSSGTPKPYSFAGVKTWVKRWTGIPHPGYTAGRRYVLMGQYGSTSTGSTLIAARMYFRPIYIPVPITISSLIGNLKTAVGSSNVQFAIYAQDPTVLHRPDARVAVTGSASSATANTNIEIALTSNATLTPGWYFVAVNSDINAIAFSAPGAPSFEVNQYCGADSLANLYSAATNSHNVPFYVASAFGTWPANLNGSTFVEETGTTRAPLFGANVFSVP